MKEKGLFSVMTTIRIVKFSSNTKWTPFVPYINLWREIWLNRLDLNTFSVEKKFYEKILMWPFLGKTKIKLKWEEFGYQYTETFCLYWSLLFGAESTTDLRLTWSRTRPLNAKNDLSESHPPRSQDSCFRIFLCILSKYSILRFRESKEPTKTA